MVLAAINVASGDFGSKHVVRTEVNGRAVISHQRDAIWRARVRCIQHHDLPTARRTAGIGQRFAIHSHVLLGFFNYPVRLAGHNKTIVGQPNAQALTTAFQRQQQHLGLLG